jgi:hypothetical protein
VDLAKDPLAPSILDSAKDPQAGLASDLVKNRKAHSIWTSRADRNAPVASRSVQEFIL